MITDVRYLRLEPGTALPSLDLPRPFVAFVVVREEVPVDWQWLVSKWIVASGCLSMAAWGTDCTSWDDSVDYANLEAFSYGDIPENRAVMTTWHEKDTLAEALFFAKHTAFHPTEPLLAALILDISLTDYEAESLVAWEQA